MKMVNKIFGLFFLLIFAIFPIVVSASNINKTTKNSFAESDVENLISPSVVLIGQHVTGKITLADVDIDLRTLTFKPILDGNSDIVINKYYTSSGFFINTDGYAVTSASNVSADGVKNKILNNIIASDFMLKMLQYPEEDIKKIKEYDNNEINNFVNKVYSYMLKNSVFDLKYNTTVIKPNSADIDLKTAIDDGVPIDVVYSNDSFFNDKKNKSDIAVVKIKDNSIPSVPVSLVDNLTVNTRTYSTGFPIDIQTQPNNFLESIYITGITVNSNKGNNGFILQTDEKVSDGLRGGPVINENGNVVGLVGVQIKNLNTGDKLVTVIPSTVIGAVLNKIGIENKVGNYDVLFKNALILKQQRHCRDAIIKFKSAQNIILAGGVNKNIDSYINECKELISSGKSIDTKWDEFTRWLGGISLVVWVAIMVGVVIVFISLIIIIFLRKHLNIEKEELKKLEGYSTGDFNDNNLEKRTNLKDLDSVNSIYTSNIDVDLIKYVKNARASNINDDITKQELKDVGWNDDEIKKVFDFTK